VAGHWDLNRACNLFDMGNVLMNRTEPWFSMIGRKTGSRIDRVLGGLVNRFAKKWNDMPLGSEFT
jgi:hypothetical protein